ncbi:hypothetical protein IC582_008564 [Cucumis melo]
MYDALPEGKESCFISEQGLMRRVVVTYNNWSPRIQNQILKQEKEHSSEENHIKLKNNITVEMTCSIFNLQKHLTFHRLTERTEIEGENGDRGRLQFLV